MIEIYHNYYRTCELVLRCTTESKELLLIKGKQLYGKKPKYFIYWYGKDISTQEESGRVEIRTLSGKKVTLGGAVKKFNEVVEASKYLVFSKLQSI